LRRPASPIVRARARHRWRVRLAETDGTIWSGSGRLVLVDLGAEEGQRRSLSGVAVPGRIVEPAPVSAADRGQVDASLRGEGMPSR
jgi:hypothetical protein